VTKTAGWQDGCIKAGEDLKMKPETIWNQRAEPSQAVTVSELYEQVETFLAGLKSRPATVAELENQSAILTQSLPELVLSAATELSMLQAQNMTLEAFALGMIRGAGDGSLLFQHRVHAPHPPLEFEAELLQPSAQTLLKNLVQITEVAGEKWPESHPDDLHLLCAYAKHENQNTLREGSQVAQQCSPQMYEFQHFLLATFKGGFATGLIQAAVTFLESP
jgi:hypothetical protein